MTFERIIAAMLLGAKSDTYRPDIQAELERRDFERSLQMDYEIRCEHEERKKQYPHDYAHFDVTGGLACRFFIYSQKLKMNLECLAIHGKRCFFVRLPNFDPWDSVYEVGIGYREFATFSFRDFHALDVYDSTNQIATDKLNIMSHFVDLHLILSKNNFNTAHPDAVKEMNGIKTKATRYGLDYIFVEGLVDKTTKKWIDYYEFLMKGIDLDIKGQMTVANY